MMTMVVWRCALEMVWTLEAHLQFDSVCSLFLLINTTLKSTHAYLFRHRQKKNFQALCVGDSLEAATLEENEAKMLCVGDVRCSGREEEE
nr:hypothetical protein Itr_chr03CG03160 [Ipomoea trifida]